jgi:hypothetical protein
MCRPGQLPGTESVCFEILGFDILIDDKLKPWVVEVNRCPSFGASQQIDYDIKSRLLTESFELLHLRASDRQRVQVMEKAQSKRRLYNGGSTATAATRTESFDAGSHRPSLADKSSVSLSSLNNSASMASLSTLNMNNMRRHKAKEKRKQEIVTKIATFRFTKPAILNLKFKLIVKIDQIKLFRREQKRQDYENRNLGNFSRLFPIEDKYDMNYYMNILSHAFNLFYPVSKQLQWKKTYERIKEDELVDQLVECDDEIADQPDYEQQKKINEVNIFLYSFFERLYFQKGKKLSTI